MRFKHEVSWKTIIHVHTRTVCCPLNPPTIPVISEKAGLLDT